MEFVNPERCEHARDVAFSSHAEGGPCFPQHTFLRCSSRGLTSKERHQFNQYFIECCERERQSTEWQCVQRGKLANSLHKAVHFEDSRASEGGAALGPDSRAAEGQRTAGDALAAPDRGMGRSDEFYWAADAEPHSRRRREILDKYGDKVRALYGFDHSTAAQVGETRPCKDWSTASGSKGSCRREGGSNSFSAAAPCTCCGCGCMRVRCSVEGVMQ